MTLKGWLIMENGCVFSGQCYKCSEKVTGANEACQAMGNLYHTKCFVCCSCGELTRETL